MSQRLERPRFINKEVRAKLAKELIYKTVPSLLSSHARAAQGVQNSRLFRAGADLPAVRSAPLVEDAERKTLKIKLIAGDSYDVAQRFRLGKPSRKIAVLNMASVFQPGGGVLRGSRAQEEALCMRSTLYPSLKPQWYRFPDDAVAYTQDVLVFGAYQPDGSVRVVDRTDMWYVDVVTCAALKQPETKRDASGEITWADPRDEERMALKIKYIMRACAKMGANVVVLGAFGCGAYGNPTPRVAALMRKCLVGRGKSLPEENWADQGIEEVVFAILDGEADKKVWNPFEKEFTDVPGVEIEPPAQK